MRICPMSLGTEWNITPESGACGLRIAYMQRNRAFWHREHDGKRPFAYITSQRDGFLQESRRLRTSHRRFRARHISQAVFLPFPRGVGSDMMERMRRFTTGYEAWHRGSRALWVVAGEAPRWRAEAWSSTRRIPFPAVVKRQHLILVPDHDTLRSTREA